MVKAIIELMLGRVGRYFLALYNEYHLFLNIIIIVYGLVLIWAHFNLRQLVHRMEAMMLELAQKDEQTPDPQAVYEAFARQWKLSQEGKKILIPSRNDLWFSMVDPKDLIEVLKIQPEYVRVVLTKAAEIQPAGAVPNHTYRAWELYRHQLLIGIRARRMEPDFQIKMRAQRNRK